MAEFSLLGVGGVTPPATHLPPPHPPQSNFYFPHQKSIPHPH